MFLLLLIDAFRADYLEKTPFLRYLASCGARGRFEEPFGFAPRHMYFGGLTPGQAGFSYLMWHDPGASPFRHSMCFPDDAALSLESRRFIRNEIAAAAKRETTAFASSYLWPFEVPMALLPYFDFPEKFSPWDSRVGYSSLFHRLGEQGKKWLFAAWPELNNLALRKDSHTVSWTLEHVEPDCEFVHVQFCDLDAVGHQFGPGSREVTEVLQETDRLVRLLLEGLHRHRRPLDLVIFGDHGMVNVVRHLDIARSLERLQARAPADYVYFLDSTAARFWYYTAGSRREVRQALNSLSGGRLLTAEDERRYEIQGSDPRNAEDIFLADPGVLITPNFYHSAAASPNGMHGYDPAEPDNQGVFITVGYDVPPGRDIGTVKARDLYSLLKYFNLRQRPGQGEGSPLVRRILCNEPDVAPAPGDAPYEQVVARDLKVITAQIAELAADCSAVILTGAFGRHEGTIMVADGQARAVNDYDVAVIGGKPIPLETAKAAGKELASRLKLPYFDLAWYPADYFVHPEPTILNYDFRYGSTVLRGDYALLEKMPLFAEADIPPGEFLRLLLNRVCGLLLGLRQEVLPPNVLDETSREFLWIQTSKAGISIADHYLAGWGAYHTLYAVRRRRFAVLGRSAGLPEEILAEIDRCFGFKKDPYISLSLDPRPVLEKLLPCLETALMDRLNCAVPAAEGERPRDLRDALLAYIQSRPSGTAGRQETIRGCCAIVFSSLRDGLQPVRLFLDSAAETAVACGTAPAIIKEGRPSDIDLYAQLRAGVLQAWESLCH